jgi:hypothetical protein
LHPSPAIGVGHITALVARFIPCLPASCEVVGLICRFSFALVRIPDLCLAVGSVEGAIITSEVFEGATQRGRPIAVFLRVIFMLHRSPS